MFMRYRPFVLCIVLLLLLSPQALAKMRVEVDYDESIDFSLFKTYAWSDGTPAPRAATQRRIVEEVNGRLQAAGLSSAGDEPDLQVVTHVSGDQFDVIKCGFQGFNRVQDVGRMTVGSVDQNYVCAGL